jgi:hypothetical protein
MVVLNAKAMQLLGINIPSIGKNIPCWRTPRENGKYGTNFDGNYFMNGSMNAGL